MNKYWMQDVKHIKPALADRIDLALINFPMRTALMFFVLAFITVIGANLAAAQ
jgi:hypothetical protein